MEEKVENPHSFDIETIIDKLDSDKNGLSESEARKRLAKYGFNELIKSQKGTAFQILLNQFKSWLVLILVGAAIISWIAGQSIDFWVIVVVIVINATIGFAQEFRAEKAIKALQKMLVETSGVLRDGELKIIISSQIVLGDIVALQEGDDIPADGRIIELNNFRTVEASLTGESLPVSKTIDKLYQETPLADQKNMVWKGTFAAGGSAKIIVTATGKNTALGDVAEAIQEIEPKRTNFMKKTDRLAKKMSIIAISSAVAIFIAGYFYRHFEIEEILLASIAALVAAVPEGLPAIITIILAIGAHRMAKKNAIIREFTATETLGVVTTILTDKTGTLTQNSLTVTDVYIPENIELTVTGEGLNPDGEFRQKEEVIVPQSNPVLQKLLKIAAISNNSEIQENDNGKLIGDPTEGAMLILAQKGGVRRERIDYVKLDDFPFDSSLRLRATLIKIDDHRELNVTGAPEEMMKRCTTYMTKKGPAKFSESVKEDVKQKITLFSNAAMRVIALAYRDVDNDNIEKDGINDLTFVGLVGMIDPLRPESKEAVENCKRAGIRVIMLTGDHLNTAVAIARKAGIINDNGEINDLARTGMQLQNLSDEEFDDVIKNISVFARLTPKIKMKIVNRLQAMGELIAMTGDGVNDAPALKKADVGIAMGIMGTDVARESSDVVLADDNFATIVNAINEGRIVFTNARQASFFLITTNIAESITFILTISLGLPLALTATQILWLNLVTDGVTGVALATEQGHGNNLNLNRPPANENILNKKILPFLFITVGLMAGLSLAVFYYYLNDSTQKAQTAVFIVLTFTQLFNVFNLRSLRYSIFKIGFFSNRYINVGVGVSLLMSILLINIPFLVEIFHFESLEVVEVIVLFAISSSILFAVELYKFLMINRASSLKVSINS